MQPKPIETITLKNGLNLELWDASRRVAADRWQVILKARIEIPVSDRWFGDATGLPAPLAEMRSALGERVCFEYQNMRNFVDAGEKEAVLNRMSVSLADNALRYYSHPDFAARWLVKQYGEYKARRAQHS